MLGAVYNTILVNPIFNILLGIYKLSGSLIVSIIVLTLIVKALSIPVLLPSMKAMKKQKDLQPELEKIKVKYKYDKKKQAELQMQLLKEHGVNPASGCYSMILTILIFAALYSVINDITRLADIGAINSKIYFDFLKLGNISEINTKFLYLDLSKPDKYFILATVAGLLQFFMTKMSMPYTQAGIEAAKQTPDKTDDLAYNMQQQTLYVLPAMMILFGSQLPAGVVIYIITSTIFSMIQSYVINGWGGLTPIVNRFIKR